MSFEGEVARTKLYYLRGRKLPPYTLYSKEFNSDLGYMRVWHTNCTITNWVLDPLPIITRKFPLHIAVPASLGFVLLCWCHASQRRQNLVPDLLPSFNRPMFQFKSKQFRLRRLGLEPQTSRWSKGRVPRIWNWMLNFLWDVLLVLTLCLQWYNCRGEIVSSGQ